mmetsp:Transcript_12757/g.40696  ORF Transcript_12757/g.40696 Transcript_12757/m.40696 type:complete len:250 (+) Transcript_12757:853-1602(+)
MHTGAARPPCAAPPLPPPPARGSECGRPPPPRLASASRLAQLLGRAEAGCGRGEAPAAACPLRPPAAPPPRAGEPRARRGRRRRRRRLETARGGAPSGGATRTRARAGCPPSAGLASLASRASLARRGLGERRALGPKAYCRWEQARARLRCCGGTCDTTTRLACASPAGRAEKESRMHGPSLRCPASPAGAAPPAPRTRRPDMAPAPARRRTGEGTARRPTGGSLSRPPSPWSPTGRKGLAGRYRTRR